MEDLKDEIAPLPWFSWVLAICICMLIWILGGIGTHWWATEFFADRIEISTQGAVKAVTNEVSNANTRGLFGDSFGAVNALISAFAFAGMIVAFIFQRYELRLQRKELEAQRKEFEDQNKTLKLQRFENTFFNMMELQQQIVNDLNATIYVKEWIEEDAPGPTMGRIRKQVTQKYEYHGRNLFLHAFNQAEHDIETTVKGRFVSVSGMRSVLQAKGLAEYDEYHTASYFDHYFRHLYRILKYVKQNSDWLKPEDQYKYTSMLRGTLSRYELVWLFYNGLTDNGYEKLKPLMEDYSILKSLRPYLLTLSKENHDSVVATVGSIDVLKDHGFSCTDYEFFLTDKKGESGYHISAFYNKEEISKGAVKLEEWKSFCKQNGIKLSDNDA